MLRADKIVKRISWIAYKKSVELRKAQWRHRGSFFTREELRPYELINRPIPNSITHQDPIFSTEHFANRIEHYSNPDGTPIQHFESLYRIGEPCYIEPDWGYVVMKPARVVIPSLPFANYTLARGPQYFSGLPSYAKIREAARGGVPVQREKSVIVLHHTFDNNYSHVHTNMLPVFRLLEEQGVSKDVPVVISPRLSRMPFFQAMQKRGELADRRWIINDSFVEADEVYFGYIPEQTRENIFYVTNLLDAPAPAENATRRVFLARKQRSIANMDELKPILDRFQFEIVDTADLSLEDQMALFAETRVVCAGHGSGLTNTFYRRDSPMTVLEIFPKHENDSTFLGFARLLNHEYHYFVAEPYEGESRWSSFRVPPERFEAFLSQSLPT